MPSLIVDHEKNIMYRSWPVHEAVAVFLCVHGMGASSARWAESAAFFNERHIACYGLELKGFGETPGPRGHIDTFTHYLHEVMHLHSIIADRAPGKPVFLMGESMGALIAFITAAQHGECFAGLIGLSPAFKSAMRFSFGFYAGVVAGLLFDPQRQLAMPFDNVMLTRDEAYQAKLDADEREHRFASARLLCEIFKAQLHCAQYARSLDKPTLFLLAGEDHVVDTRASEKIFSLIPGDKKRIAYPAMRHALSIEVDRERVFQDIAAWVEKYIG